MEDTISRAVVVYVKAQLSARLGREALAVAFGRDRGERLAQVVEEILGTVRYEPGDTLPQPTLEESWATNASALRRAHPELDEAAIQAVESQFYFDNFW